MVLGAKPRPLRENGGPRVRSGGGGSPDLWGVLQGAGFPNRSGVPGEPNGLTPIQMAYAVAKAESGGNLAPGGNLFQIVRNPPSSPSENARRAYAMSAGGTNWTPWCVAFGGPRDPATGAKYNCGGPGSNYLKTVDGIAPAYTQYVHEAAGGKSGKGGSSPGASYYDNPLRGIRGLTVQRIDEGVDYTGSGPIYPIGKARVYRVLHNTGWRTPGCDDSVFVGYTLLEGPLAGRSVYVSECFRPSVREGQVVDTRTPLGQLYGARPSIETGWADAGTTDLALAATKGGGYDEGECTALGRDFNSLMTALGARTSFCSGPVGGILPPNWLPSAGMIGGTDAGEGIPTFGLTAAQRDAVRAALGSCSQGGSANSAICQQLAVKVCVSKGGDSGACSNYVDAFVNRLVQRAFNAPCQTFDPGIGPFHFCMDKPIAVLGIAFAVVIIAFGIYLVVRSSGGREMRRVGEALAPLTEAPVLRTAFGPLKQASARRSALGAERATQRRRGARAEAEARVSATGRTIPRRQHLAERASREQTEGAAAENAPGETVPRRAANMRRREQ